MKPNYIAIIIEAFLLSSLIQSNAVSQTVNREAKDAGNNIILLGKSTRERLKQEPFAGWFNTNYTAYTIDTATANQLKPFIKNKRFLIFMGTWCGDSRREVPRMYKLLDYCGVQPSQIELINVNGHDSAYKQSPGHEERGLNIHRVPDLLVYENDNETGRVVEFPVQSWEKDLLQIFTNQPYTPNYSGVNTVHQLLGKKSLKKIAKRKQQIAEQLKPITKNRFELYSYAKIQQALHQPGKAFLINEVNTLLFPGDPEVWNNMAACYLAKGDKASAIENYKKALSLQPANELATNMLKQLNGQ